MDLRTWLVILTVAGFVITVGGLVAAWIGARREYDDASRRIDKMEELSRGERADQPENRRSETTEEATARHERWTAEYAKHGLTRPTYDNMVFLAAYESRRLLGLVLKSTGRDFLVAAFGLLVSTGASVGSLFLTS